MRGSVQEYRPGRWRIYLYWKGEDLLIYRNRDGEVFETRKQTEKTLFKINTEIEDRTFDPKDWLKDRPFLLACAAETWQKLSSCGEDRQKIRWYIYEKHIAPKFGSMDIRDIRSVHISEFQFDLIQKGLSQYYIKDVLAVLRGILYFHRDSIPRLPVFPTVTVDEKEIHWLSSEQQDKVFEFLKEDDLPIFWFLRMTGCRPSEACALYREDVDWEKGIVTVHRSMGNGSKVHDYTKNRRIKRIPIFDELAGVLTPKQATANLRFVFSNKGKPYHRKRLEEAWNRACDAAGVARIPLKNATRHSFASQRINQGFSMDLISKALGHTSIRVTERIYANITPQTLEDVYRGTVTVLSRDKKEASNLPK